MRGTIVRVGSTGAGVVLAVGLLMAQPAGATGSGRHGKSGKNGTASAACFDPSGKTQGRSHSDPDGMSNGGPDKPGCSGGFDRDRDGNNGCGNDADREDDNNGRCGGKKDRSRVGAVQGDRTKQCDRDKGLKPGAAATSTTSTSSTSTSTTSTTTAPATALGTTPVGLESAGSNSGVGVLASTTAADTPAVVAAPLAAPADVEVLGETIERPSALARTGAGVGGLTLLGGLLCGGGRLAILARRFLRID